MRPMTIGQLRAVLAELPDDAPVLVPGHDHSYQPGHAEPATARFLHRAGWTEDHGEDATPTIEYGPARPVLVVR